YQRISAGRRARLHRLIGDREEAGYGERARDRAAELAMHFERGRDYPRAVQYLQQAAENAAQRHAHHEVTALVTKGLELLATLPETPARAQQELDFQLALGPALMATKSPAAPEVGGAAGRDLRIGAGVSATPQRGCPRLPGARRALARVERARPPARTGHRPARPADYLHHGLWRPP